MLTSTFKTHPAEKPASRTRQGEPLRPSHSGDWIKLLLEAVATSLGIALALVVAVMLAASVARADVSSSAESRQSGEAPKRIKAPDGAALILKTADGYITAPLQRSDVKLQVTGHIVRAVVTQTYSNPNPVWIHGTYQFPLPTNSAVDTMKMQVGGRVIVGEIEPRERASKLFAKAQSDGRRATIIEQQRPNVFTAGVANIAPNSDIMISIEYQQVLTLDRNGWTLRFPTVVAPRYSPPNISDQAAPQATRSTFATNHSLPYQPVMLKPDKQQNRLSIEVIVDAGVPVNIPSSATHDVVVTTARSASTIDQTQFSPPPVYTVQLSTEALADRDFELRWSPRPLADPIAGLQWEKHGPDWYGLLTVAPPTISETTLIGKPRELVLILDTSGSMHGLLDDAKKAVLFALEALSPSDRFNLIEFNSQHSVLFPASRQATANNLQIARRYVRSLRASGGTEMRSALLEALKTSIPADYFSQVVFVTDGAVANEAELFNLIETMLGERKLFTVGIGSAPNGYFMKAAAAAGRGSFTLINQDAEITRQMTLLFERMTSPMLTRLQLRDDTGELINIGTPIRDLYAGDPLMLAFRLPLKPESVVIEGEQNEFAWQQAVTTHVVEGRGIDKLWARDEIESLANKIRRFSMDGRDPAQLREQATKVAMNHHLVSAYTSLVAIDATPGRATDETVAETAVPRHLPRKFAAAAVGGSGMTLASTSTGLFWQLLTGAILLLLATVFVAIFLFRAQTLLDSNHSST